MTTDFGRHSTAAEVLRGHDLTGRLALVTGASAGLGAETAFRLAEAGADLVVGARRMDDLEAFKARVVEQTGRSVHAHPLDLMSVESVDRFADWALSLGRPVDILVANAGVMVCPLSRAESGIERQLMTNFVGHAVLISRLASALRAAPEARVISLSSVGHHFSPVDLDDLNFERRPYERWSAYGQSKTACALLATHVATRLGDAGVTGLAVHPGMILTELAQHLDETEQARAEARRQADPDAYKTVESGAATSIWAATAPELRGRGPLYLEDCGVAERIETPNFASGVLPYALDPDAAQGLWSSTEALLGRPLPL